MTAFFKRNTTMRRTTAATLLAGALLLTVGCGQTGPLYLPENAPDYGRSDDRKPADDSDKENTEES